MNIDDSSMLRVVLFLDADSLRSLHKVVPAQIDKIADTAHARSSRKCLLVEREVRDLEEKNRKIQLALSSLWAMASLAYVGTEEVIDNAYTMQDFNSYISDLKKVHERFGVIGSDMISLATDMMSEATEFKCPATHGNCPNCNQLWAGNGVFMRDLVYGLLMDCNPARGFNLPCCGRMARLLRLVNQSSKKFNTFIDLFEKFVTYCHYDISEYSSKRRLYRENRDQEILLDFFRRFNRRESIVVDFIT